MKKEQTIISTSGAGNLFQRFLGATLWDGNQETRPDSIIYWYRIELNTDGEELIASLYTTQKVILFFHLMTWIKSIRSIEPIYEKGPNSQTGIKLEVVIKEQTQITPLDMLRAYQHFLYYFDQVSFREANIFGQTLTDHFLGKLSMYRSIHCPEGYNSLAVLVTWVQNMTDHYQAQLMEQYILKYHLNKW